VYDALDRAVARRLLSEADNTTLIYAYEDGARESFIAAEKTGRKRIYDLPIAHWRTLRRLLEEEADRLPEWACTMEGLKDSQAKHDRKDSELHLANEVVVASSFTQKSVQGDFPDLPVHVTPYGCPEPRLDKPTARGEGAPLELVFAGHLAQRKGIADLISALDLLAVDWRLTIAGPLPAEVPQPLEHFLKNRRVNWLGAVPHITLMEQMRQAHAFVFPSIVEGFGMVITEALAAGLPVITTPNTCGPDILTEGQDGYIIPIRDPEALADRITRLAENEPKRRAMAASALRTAQRMSWSRYETQISGLVTEWCDK
jgi:glycosyltransferase involved in cell wall biosynthesis